MDKSLRFLIVDDEPSVLQFLQCLVEREGHEVHLASNGREALELMEVESFDFVLSDWMMPELDGLELCRRIRQMELSDYIYLLVLTARSDSADAVEALDAGADDFIAKPIDPELLSARIKSGIRVLMLERDLHRRCDRDSLTGLIHRGSLDETLKTEWDRSVKYESPFSCVMIDIDGFKKINEIHGQPAADQVLRQVTGLLRSEIRSTDDVARYGGDEFVLLLAWTSLDEATAVAERCCQSIANATFEAEGQEKGIRVTASLGVASKSESVIDHVRLLELADQSLIKAKQLGPGRVEVDRSGVPVGG